MSVIKDMRELLDESANAHSSPKEMPELDPKDWKEVEDGYEQVPRPGTGA